MTSKVRPYTGHGWDGDSPTPRKSFKECCSLMKVHLENRCRVHSRYKCPDVLLDRHSDGKIGIIVHDGGCRLVVINFCPWCWCKLPYGKG